MSKIYRVTKGCTGCYTCIYECPGGAISFGMEGAVIDEEKCVGCGICYENCASEAIEGPLEKDAVKP